MKTSLSVFIEMLGQVGWAVWLRITLRHCLLSPFRWSPHRQTSKWHFCFFEIWEKAFRSSTCSIKLVLHWRHKPAWWCKCLTFSCYWGEGLRARLSEAVLCKVVSAGGDKDCVLHFVTSLSVSLLLLINLFKENPPPQQDMQIPS